MWNEERRMPTGKQRSTYNSPFSTLRSPRLVYAFFRLILRYRYRTIIDLRCGLTIVPGEGMLHPILIVALGEVFTRMAATGFVTIKRAGDDHFRGIEQVTEFDRLQ